MALLTGCLTPIYVEIPSSYSLCYIRIAQCFASINPYVLLRSCSPTSKLPRHTLSMERIVNIKLVSKNKAIHRVSKSVK